MHLQKVHLPSPQPPSSMHAPSSSQVGKYQPWLLDHKNQGPTANPPPCCCCRGVCLSRPLHIVLTVKRVGMRTALLDIKFMYCTWGRCYSLRPSALVRFTADILVSTSTFTLLGDHDSFSGDDGGPALRHAEPCIASRMVWQLLPSDQVPSHPLSARHS